MISKAIDKILPEDITALVDNSVREERTLEFKRELPGTTDKAKKEFLADVSSFANATGGDLIYGIEEEEDGVASAIPGIDHFDENKERLRLESSIRDGIDPRIPAIQVHTVLAGNKGPVLIIRIPRSWAGPHMVTFKGDSKFFSRSSNGKFQMDVTELRAAFEGVAELSTRIARWRDERLGRIIANEGPIPLHSQTCLVLHLVPFESFANEWRLNGGEIAEASGAFKPIGGSGWDHQMNIDGLLTFTQPPSDKRRIGPSYTQLFRSGRIEAVVDGFLVENEERRAIPSEWYEEKLVDSTRTYLNSLAKLDIQPPIVFLLTMTGMKGATMAAGGVRFDPYLSPINRDVLMFPDVLIETYDCDLPQVLRPVFDSVWNACGYKRSFNYDEEGNWKLK